MRGRLAVVLLALAFAGCTAPAAQLPDDALPPAVGEPFTVDLSLIGCVEVGGGRLVSFEHARTLLPEGIEPADASEFLGMPAPAGRAAALAGHVVCESSVADGGRSVAWSNLIVPIEAPDVPEAPPGPGMHLYQIAHFTSGEETLAILRSVGFLAEDADIVAEHTLAAPVPHARASTATANGTLAEFEVASAMPQPYNLVARFWHETPSGLAYFDHVRTPTTVRIGPLSMCAAAPGSVFAEAWGEACEGSDAIGGLFEEPTDFETTFGFLPGVRIGGSAAR